MKTKKLLGRAGVLLCSLAMLTACDYSNFSLFGFFYNIYEQGVESQYTKGGSGNTSSTAADSGNNESSTEPVANVFVPQYYQVESSSTIADGTVDITKILTLLDEDTYSLFLYEKLTPTSGDARTYRTFTMHGSYTRENNDVNLAIGPNVWTDRTDSANVLYSNGEADDVRLSNFKTAFGSESSVAKLGADGSFSFDGTAASETASGLSNANTYWIEETAGRPTYKQVTLFTDGTYWLNSFALAGSNPNQPVSSFLVKGTYTTYADLATDDYEVVKIGDGLGHMYARNGAVDMEFDIPTADSFQQWYGMSFGSIFSLNVSKKGYTNKYGDEIHAYGFEILEAEVGSDTPEPEPEPEPEPSDGSLFTLTYPTSTGVDMEMKFFKDGTFNFAWSKYNVSVDGTWSYSDGQLLMAADGYTIDYGTVTVDGDGKYSFDSENLPTDGSLGIYFHSDSGLGAYFTLTKDQYDMLTTAGDAAVLTLEYATSSVPMTFAFKEDGTAEFAWAQYNLSYTCGWCFEDGKLLILPADNLSVDYGTITVSDTGAYSIDVTTEPTDGSRQFKIYSAQGLAAYFTVTKDDIATLRALDAVFTVNYPTSAGVDMTMTFHKDHTAEFAWSKYNLNYAVEWAFQDGSLSVFADGFTVTYGTVDPDTYTLDADTQPTDGSCQFKIAASSGLAACFIVSADQVKELRALDALFTVNYPTSAGVDMTFTFHKDKTAEFAWAKYNLNYNVNWAFVDGQLQISADGFTVTYGTVDPTAYTLDADTQPTDGSCQFKIAASSGLAACFIVSADQVKQLRALDAMFTVNYPTSAGVDMTMTFHEDGSAEFAWAKYNLNYAVKWYFQDGALKIEKDGFTVTYGTVDPTTYALDADTQPTDGSCQFKIAAASGLAACFIVSASQVAQLKVIYDLANL